MKKHSLFAILIVTAICFTPVIYAQTGANESNHEVTTQDIQTETRELIETLQQYSVEQRDEAVNATEQMLESLDQRIDVLQRRIDNNWDEMSDEARQTTRDNMRALREQRNKLSEWYGGLKNSTDSAWDQMKAGFSDAYSSMSNAWEKAKNEYEDNDK
ncbi:sll1863 family stress response protein [Nitrincola iocasae]|uniref:Uncharacterized protein n=1 Tax=Nitrincola iocasae TaxID=2614693 RepID=A0A5J6LCT6_9GAMM|nr:hypothetical protein [Nitrincola iocasae]QEW06419.1 hypothetical protein F5I99_07810 [Nitrincola iocasae]